MSVPRYPAYKDSGVEWLGEIPAHWEVLALKRVASISYGIGEPPQYRPDGIPLIRATNVHNGQIYESGFVFVDPEDIPEKRIFWLQAGDIIVVRSGAYTGDSATILEKNCPAIAGFDMILRPQNCDPVFLQFSLLSFYLKEQQIDLAKMRAAQPHLNAEELGSCVLIYPELAEQKSIAAFLSTETAKIDALIAEQEHLIALLKEKRQAVISHAVTKGLNPDVPMKESGSRWLGKIPVNWDVLPLKHACLHVVDCLHTTPHYEGDVKYPAIRTSDIDRGIIFIEQARLVNDEVYSERIQRLKPEPGDILYSREGERFGMAALIPKGVTLCLGQRMMMFRVNGNFHPEYVMWVLNSSSIYDQVLEKVTGSTSPHVNISDIINFRIAKPKLPEQEEIAQFIRINVHEIDGLIKEAGHAITLLQERRSAVISAAVTGKIDVRGLVKAQEKAA